MDAIMPDASVHSIVAGYLPPTDALCLAATCKKIHAKLSLTATPPRELLAEFSWRHRDEDPRRGFGIPVPNAVKCHSVLLSATWKDEGQARGQERQEGTGRREGRVFVVAERKDRPPPADGRPSSKPFGGGRLVCASAPAPETARRFDISFQPKETETYYLWYTVGRASGSSCSLSLSSVTIQALFFDDPTRSFGNAHNFLARTNTLPAWDRENAPMVHLDVCSFLESHEDQLLPTLITFPARDTSREDVQRDKLFQAFVRSIWEGWSQEHYAYARTIATGTHHQYQEVLRRLEAMQVYNFVEDRADFGEHAVVVEDC